MTLKRMTCFLAALALLALAAAPAAAGWGDKERYEEKFQKTEKLPADGKVFLANISGNVKVLTWAKDEVFIDALKVSKAGSLEKAKENAALVKIEVSRNDGRLEIKTKYPEGDNRKRDLNVSINYVLTVPAKAEVEVNNVSGNVQGENIGGRAKLETVSGDVIAAGMAKGGAFVTVSGDVELKDIKGDLKAKAISGDITITKTAGAVDVETISGSVDIKGLTGSKSVEVNVLSGNVDFDGALDPEGEYSFETHSGDLTIVLPENSAFDFTCKTFSGDITSDFKAIVEMQGKLKGSKHGLSKDDIRGTVNGGGADLTLKTFSGDIELKKR